MFRVRSGANPQQKRSKKGGLSRPARLRRTEAPDAEEGIESHHFRLPPGANIGDGNESRGKGGKGCAPKHLSGSDSALAFEGYGDGLKTWRGRRNLNSRFAAHCPFNGGVKSRIEWMYAQPMIGAQAFWKMDQLRKETSKGQRHQGGIHGCNKPVLKENETFWGGASEKKG